MNGFPNSLRCLVLVLLSACQSDTAFDNNVNNVAADASTSGNVIVATLATDPSTGPGLVAQFDSTGALTSIVHDYYESLDFPSGLALVSSNELLVSVDGIDRVDRIDLLTGVITPFTVSAQITSAPLRQIARADDGSLFILEGSTKTIEKVNAQGSRVGNPFIGTTTGSCVLNSPWGIAYIPTNNTIAVINMVAAGGLLIYDLNGNCVSSKTTAPFNSGTPTGVAFQATTGKLIVTFSTSHAIYAVNVDGSGATQIYLNSGIINTPRAVAVDSSGDIYVGSNGTDTIEKLTYTGSGVATRALPGPFAGPSIYTQNATAIVVRP